MNTDYLIAGGGIAGMSAAAALAQHGRVILIEQETHLAYHSTGRSAAIFADSYGDAVIQSLSRFSRPFLANDMLTDAPLLTARGILHLIPTYDAPPNPADKRTLYDKLSEAEVRALIPSMRVGAVQVAHWEATAADIDVHGLQTAFERRMKAEGGKVMVSAAVRGASRAGDAWNVDLGTTTISTPIVINAAGAWAAHVGALFGAGDPGLLPTRRSAALVRPPAELNVADWPMAVPFDGRVYWKPEGGKLMVSPAEEVATQPHDTFSDDMEIAQGIDRFEQFIDWRVNRVETTWAGLRTLTADGHPVVGADPQVAGLFWLAGQGGYGIQTAPATSELLAAAVLDRKPQGDLADVVDACAPGRVIAR